MRELRRFAVVGVHASFDASGREAEVALRLRSKRFMVRV